MLLAYFFVSSLFLTIFRPAKLILAGRLKNVFNFMVGSKVLAIKNSHLNFGRISYLNLKSKILIAQL